MATDERNLHHMSGYLAALVVLAAAAVGILLIGAGAADGPGDNGNPPAIWLGIALFVVSAVSLRGFVVVAPNEAKVVNLLGKYRGTLSQAGFHWINPISTRQSVSLRVRNLDSDTLKSNDAAGNPVEIAAVINWWCATPRWRRSTRSSAIFRVGFSRSRASSTAR